MKRVIRVWRILAVSFVCLIFLAALYETVAGSPHHAVLRDIYGFLGIAGSEPPPKYILFFALILFAEIPFMIKAGDSEKASLPAAERGADGPGKGEDPQTEKEAEQPAFTAAARDAGRGPETQENLNDKLKIALERAEEEARARAERKARAREEKKARERAEKEARERAEKEARERAEKEARERVEKEARERVEKEAREREEKEAREREEKEAREREEKKTRVRAVKPELRKEWPEPDWLGDVQPAAEVQPLPDVSMEAADFDRFLSELKAELFEE